MDPQTKQLQIEMKRLGLYDGPVDGVMGPSTKAAIDLYERKKREDAATAASQKAQLDQQAADAAAERTRKDAAAAAERTRQDQEAQAERDRKTGIVQAGSVGAGLGAGLSGSKIAEHYANPAAKAEMGARDAQLKRLAASIRAVDPNARGARSMYGDLAAAADTGRLTKRPLPWGTAPTGLGLLGMGAYSSFDRAPNSKSDVERAIWQGTGYGELTAGGKMLYDSLRRYQNPGIAYSADDLAAVEAARRMAQGGPLTPVPPSASSAPYEPPSSAPETLAPTRAVSKPGTKPDLYAQAKARGLPVTTRMPKSEIEQILGDAMKANAKKLASKAPKALIPAAVGYGVYDALRNPAAASDGSAPEPMPAPEAAAIGTGAGAATGFGLQRLKDAILGTRAGSIALRGLGRVAGPLGMGMMAHDVANGVYDLAHLSPPLPDSEGSTMYGFEPPTSSPMQQASQPGGDMPAMTDDEVARGKAWLAQNMPEALGSDQTAPAPGNQSYPLSGQMQDAAGQDQQAVMDSLANLGASDPEIAQMIRDLIQARVSQGAPAQ